MRDARKGTMRLEPTRGEIMAFIQIIEVRTCRAELADAPPTFVDLDVVGDRG